MVSDITAGEVEKNQIDRTKLDKKNELNSS